MPKRSLLNILLCLLFLSCKKEVVHTEPGPAGEKGAPGTTIPGTIKGVIHYVDQHYEPYLTGLNSTTVTVMGTNLSAISDINGGFEIKDVPPGTYNISIEKEGCGKIQRQQIAFPGNGTYYLNDTIFDRATFPIQNCYAKNSYYIPPYGGNTTSVKDVIINLDPSTKRRAAILLLSGDSLLELSTRKFGDEVYMIDLAPSTGSASIMLKRTWGYVRIYPNAVGHKGAGYLDIQSGKMVYPNVGPPYPILKLHN